MRRPHLFARACSTLLTALLLTTGLTAQPVSAATGGATETATAASAEAGVSDTIAFADTASERAHDFSGSNTEVVDGAMGFKARVATPLTPPRDRLGDLRLTAKVDPARQNYLTLKFWGGEASPLRTVLYVNGAQAQFRTSGDYEAVNPGFGAGLPDRFYYTTAMLPLASTQGHDKVEVIVRTHAASFTSTATTQSRRYYAATVHTSAAYTPPAADDTGYKVTTKAAPALTAQRQQELIDSYRAQQISHFDSLTRKADATPPVPMPIGRYKDDLRFYAETLLTDWSPVRTDAEKRAALERIFASVDAYTRQYYGNVKSLGNGGHQSDWGGYYGALGEALYIVENLIGDDGVCGQERFRAFLDAPFATGTTAGDNSLPSTDWEGGELTRGEAWERVLKANFDFARSRLSYIYNQMMYTYEGAWKAHEGLRVIGSAFYEGKQRSHRIAGESLGWEPFLGEEVLVGPDGKALDLTHSLFQHDRNAVYTDDYLKIVMRGLAKSKTDENGDVVRRKPYGAHYTGITRDGLTRENGYVGSYGESTNYVMSWFFRTLGHQGDESMNDEILKLALLNVHARGQTRYQSTDADGNRVMLMQQVIDDRNTAYPGKIAYAVDANTGRGIAHASLEQYMADHPGRYSGAEWQPYWSYAREATGFAQQQLADNQYFPYFAKVLAEHRYDLRLPDTYAYVTGGRAERERLGGKTAAGVLLPQTDTDRYTDEELAKLGVDRATYEKPYAWADIDNLFVSFRDSRGVGGGAIRVFGNLFHRNKGFLGNGRLHVQRDGHDQLVQIETEGVLTYRDYVPRAGSTEDPMFFDRYTAPDRPLALAGELVPVAHQPGVGTVDRDNFVQDNPYSGYPDLLTARYGAYLIAFNTTRAAYGNEKAHRVALPAGFPGTKVRDLISGRELPVAQGKVTVPPLRAVVLDLGTEKVTPAAPGPVDVLVTTPGARAVGLSWARSSGATSYAVERAEGDGPFRTVATGIRGTSHIDDGPKDEAQYRYRVIPLNSEGAGRPSQAVTAKTVRAGALGDSGWQSTAIGSQARGTAALDGSALTLSGVAGEGFGRGDDSVLGKRWEKDSFVLAARLARGGTEVSAELEPDAVSGVLLRDSTDPVARYAYLGAEADGDLVLHHRSMDSRADIGTGTAGQNAGGGKTRSPAAEPLTGYDVNSHPYVKLVRLPASEWVLALVSEDGEEWEQAARVSLPMAEVVLAGVGATTDAAFTSTTVGTLDEDVVLADADFTSASRTGTVTWTKPKDAVAFSLYRSRDPKSGSWQKLLDHEWALTYTDTVHGGTMYYKVVAHHADGATSTASAHAVLVADAFDKVLAAARALQAADYTASGFAKFTAELDAAEQAAADPGADPEALIKKVYDAYGLLVRVYRTSFEAGDPDVWAGAGSGPYTRVIDASDARTGTRAMRFTSTDATYNGSHNLSFRPHAAGNSPISAKPANRYTVSFWYKLENYTYGSGFGAYLFATSYAGPNRVGAETRYWIRQGDTPAGQWVKFERTYTTQSDATVDSISLDIGFRGAKGTFRVDDLRVEPAA